MSPVAWSRGRGSRVAANVWVSASEVDVVNSIPDRASTARLGGCRECSSTAAVPRTLRPGLPPRFAADVTRDRPGRDSPPSPTCSTNYFRRAPELARRVVFLAVVFFAVLLLPAAFSAVTGAAAACSAATCSAATTSACLASI